MYLLEVNTTVVGVNTHREIDEFIVDQELQFFKFVLFVISPRLHGPFRKNGLEGRALEGFIAMADYNDVVVAGRYGLSGNSATFSILLLFISN
jgi:hypothetical protein